MNRWRRNALLVTLCAMYFSAAAQQAQLVSALIDGCASGNDGADEWVMVYSGSASFTASTSTLDLRYGTTDPATTTFTDQFDADGDATFVAGLNTRITDQGSCNFSFINVTPASTVIPAGSHILIFNDDVLTSGTTIDYDAWCGSFQSGSNIYVLFSTDTSWPSGGLFDNAPGSTTYFRSVINSNTVDFNYADNWSSTSGGNYVTWIDGGGAGSIYSNYSSCQPTNSDLLPVTLIGFSATAMQDHISLNWATAEESGNSHFTLYKSANGMEWDPLTVVPGNGTSSEMNHYQYRDYDPTPGRSYYRLQQTDFNGDSETFEAISVIFDPSQVKLKLFPNPSSDYISIDCSEKIDCLSLINSHGQLFRVDNIARAGMKSRFDIRHIPQGIYRVLIHGTQTIFREKLIKVN